MHVLYSKYLNVYHSVTLSSYSKAAESMWKKYLILRWSTEALPLSKIIHVFGPCPVSCGGCIFDKQEGHLSSPGYPGTSPPNLSCKYIISVKPRFTVTLNFADNFHIQTVNTLQGPRCQHHWLQVLAKVFLTLNYNKKSTTLRCLSAYKWTSHNFSPWGDHPRQTAYEALWRKESRCDSYKFQYCETGLPHWWWRPESWLEPRLQHTRWRTKWETWCRHNCRYMTNNTITSFPEVQFPFLGNVAKVAPVYVIFLDANISKPSHVIFDISKLSNKYYCKHCRKCSD